MSRDARFWRNVAFVAAAHLVILLALARGSRESASPNLQTVVWMNSEASAAAEVRPTPAPSPTLAENEKPTPAPTILAAAKSEIVMPSPSPTPTITPKPSAAPKPSGTPTPKSSPKPSPKPTPKATPSKSAEPKSTPKPSENKNEKKSAPPAKKDSSTSSNQTAPKSDSSTKGSGNAATQPSEFAWYGTMLHDRFHRAWEQPKSVVATGAKMSTIVKIRIEKDGRVSKFAIVKPSGNVVMDESVTAIAQRVTQVDPLPEGLAQKSYYEVKIDFELNAEK
jgi:TonB family protein